MTDPSLVLTYECNIPTLNEYIEVERTNKYSAANMKRAITNRIKFWTMNQTRVKIVGLHDIVLTWTRNDRRHDADNVYAGVKFILDGIVASGTLAEDNRKCIRNISHRIQQGKNETVVVEFFKV